MSGDAWHLRRTNWCGEAAETLDDEVGGGGRGEGVRGGGGRGEAASHCGVGPWL